MKQTNNKANRNIKKSHRSRRTVAVFWIGLILVLAPIVVLGWVLFSSAMDTGSPVFGNRYEGDLDPSITKSDLKTVDEKVAGLDGVQAEFSNLASATLRVYAQISQDATADDATAKAQEIYSTISEVLDPSVYFTQADGKKMYDLEIHVYNMDSSQDRTSDAFVYVIDTKTSSMTDPECQTVSEARYPELAEQLRQDVENRKAAAAAASASPQATAAASADVGTTDSTEGQ